MGGGGGGMAELVTAISCGFAFEGVAFFGHLFAQNESTWHS
jgi:hypothetical protein